MPWLFTHRSRYPYDENEDPFIWKNARGFHALFHANTWGDSRGAVFPVPAYAGRLAYSVDGVVWTYAEEPPYNGTVMWVARCPPLRSSVLDSCCCIPLDVSCALKQSDTTTFGCR